MLVCVSANHRATPLADLERLTAAESRIAAVLPAAHAEIAGSVVVATCNRVEAYLDVADGDDLDVAVAATIDELARAAEIDRRTLREQVDVQIGNRVAHHLFAVAAGLDSVAVGEEEIAGQVRRAYDAARTGGTTTRALEYLFERAAEASREVKNATPLAESGRSLVRLAIRLVESRIVTWADARVVIVGTGRYAAVTLAALRRAGATRIAVVSWSGRADAFAARHGIRAAADVAAEIARADVVIACTTRRCIDATLLAEGRGRSLQPAGQQVIVDLGMPRNVDPDVTEVAGVELLDLDTLRLHAPIDEDRTLRDARTRIADAARRHARGRRVHDVSGSVVAVRGWMNELIEAEAARLRARGGASAPESERAMRHFAGVAMHHLIARGHALAAVGDGEEWARAVRAVFAAAPGAASAVPEQAPTGTDD